MNDKKVIIKEVNFSDIKSHPFHSLSPAEHMGKKWVVMKYLRRFGKTDKIRLQWMLNTKVLSWSRMKEYVVETIRDMLRGPVKRARQLLHNLNGLPKNQ